MARLKRSLTIRAGKNAKRSLQRGIHPDKIKTVIGAAGGPKWLALSQIDRVLFGEWFRNRKDPLHLVGSSIAAWRFSAIAQKNPIEAVSRFENAYFDQRYYRRPTPAEATEKTLKVLNDYVSDTAVKEILTHPYLRLNILVVRCRHLVAQENMPTLLAGLGLAASANVIHPNLLNSFFHRTFFSDPRDTAGFIKDQRVKATVFPLIPSNYRDVVMASGAIPAVMSGVRNINEAPSGIYRDGGVLDYHPDMPFADSEDEIVLFPHYTDKVIPNWFDKNLPWRKNSNRYFDNVLLIAPSREFLDTLPLKKIPDRKDFYLFVHRDEERLKYWNTVIQECSRMSDELFMLLEKGEIPEDYLKES